MLSKLRMDLKDHCLPSLRNYSLIKDLCKGFQDTFMWKINYIKGPRASVHHIFYWRFPFLILVNVSFTEEFLKVTASLALRILNPKVDAPLTSLFCFFFSILGTLVGVRCVQWSFSWWIVMRLLVDAFIALKKTFLKCALQKPQELRICVVSLLWRLIFLHDSSSMWFIFHVANSW